MTDTFGGNTGSPVPQAPSTAIPTGGGFSPTITSANLAQQSQIQVPAPVTPATPNTGGASSMISTNNASLNPAQPTNSDPNSLQAQMQALLGNDSKTSSANTDAYTSTYGISPDQARADQATSQSGLNSANTAVQAAQEKYNTLDAQIKGLDYQASSVIPNQVIQDGTGRMSVDGERGQNEIQQRQLLLQKAPLQYQALLAQADLANAQGKATLAKGILDQADSHLNALFAAQKDDIAQNAAHQKDAIDKAWKEALFNYHL